MSKRNKRRTTEARRAAARANGNGPLGARASEIAKRTQSHFRTPRATLALPERALTCCAFQTALLDVTMDRTEEEIVGEFSGIPNSTRTALAFAKEAGTNGALALLNRYAGRHSREWHKAIDELRAIQNERLDPEKPKLPDEPGDLIENEQSHLAPASVPSAPEAHTTGCQQGATGIPQNEPESASEPLLANPSEPCAALALPLLQNEPERTLTLLKSIAQSEAARPLDPLQH